MIDWRPIAELPAKNGPVLCWVVHGDQRGWHPYAEVRFPEIVTRHNVDFVSPKFISGFGKITHFATIQPPEETP